MTIEIWDMSRADLIHKLDELLSRPSSFGCRDNGRALLDELVDVVEEILQRCNSDDVEYLVLERCHRDLKCNQGLSHFAFKPHLLPKFVDEVKHIRHEWRIAADELAALKKRLAKRVTDNAAARYANAHPEEPIKSVLEKFGIKGSIKAWKDRIEVPLNPRPRGRKPNS